MYLFETSFGINYIVIVYNQRRNERLPTMQRFISILKLKFTPTHAEILYTFNRIFLYEKFAFLKVSCCNCVIYM